MTENEQLPPGGLGTRVQCPFDRLPPRPWAAPGDRDPLASLWAAGQGWVGVRPRPVNSCFGSSEGGHFGSELRHCRPWGKAVQNRAPHSVFAPLHTAPSKGLLGHGNCSMAPWILQEGVPILTSEPRAQRETLAFTVSTVPVVPAGLCPWTWAQEPEALSHSSRPRTQASWHCSGTRLGMLRGPQDICSQTNPEALLSLVGVVSLGVKNSPQWPFASFNSTSLA